MGPSEPGGSFVPTPKHTHFLVDSEIEGAGCTQTGL